MHKKYSRVYVEITNICNRNCSFCPGTSRAHRSMSLDDFSIVLSSLSGLTDYIYLHVMGEPLTHPLLPSFISLATSRGFKVAITTNGTLLPSRGESILDSPLYKINISLHSFEEGERSTYLSYINGCLDFAARSADAGILTILRLWNKGYDNGRNIDTLSLIKEKFPEGENEWKYGDRGARIRHKLHLEYGERFAWPDMSCDDMGEQVFCYGLGDHFGILSDGRVIPCCLDREGEITLGNILEGDNLAEILASDRAEKIRQGFLARCAVEDLCHRCGYARRFKV